MEDDRDGSLDARGPRIPQVKMLSIKPYPTVAIFHKCHSSAPSISLDAKFPRDAAMVFSDRIRQDLMDHGSKSFTILGGDLSSFKEVFKWIRTCVGAQRIEKFHELDEDDPEVLKKYALIIAAGKYLEIPARDLSGPLLKRVFAISRKVKMSWNDVVWFYESPMLNCVSDVRTVGAASIFYAWWNRKLDKDETPQEMAFLDILRKEKPELDEDLHEWCANNEADVKKRRKEKRMRQGDSAANGDGAGGGSGTGWEDAAALSSNGGGWEVNSNSAQFHEHWKKEDGGASASRSTSVPVWSDAASNSHETNSWEVRDSNSNTPAASNDTQGSVHSGDILMDKSNQLVNSFGDNSGRDWADEVNEYSSRDMGPDQLWRAPVPKAAL